MLKINIFLLLALLSLTKAFAGSDDTFPAQIKQTIDNENIVGLSWSTVSGEDIDVGSVGYANIEKQTLVKQTQKMHVGSVTKSVLAIGVLQLISEGKLSLDLNVETLLPELNFDNPWHQHSPIKVKNLLDHTAGLDNIRLWQLLSTKPLPNSPLRDAFSSHSANLLTVRTEPGTQYSYSNMGYTLLAMVIESVTNQRYEKFLDDNLLEPLGMHNSSFEFISQEGILADPLLAMGYHERNVAQAAVPNYLRPAGQFTTTALDMAKFIKFLLNNGQVNSKRLVNADLMARLSHPLNTKAHIAGLTIGHGLAFANRDRNNVLGMCHPGTTFGFRAYICLFPDEKKGYFYAANTNNETADYETFNKLFIRKLDITTIPIAKPTGVGVALPTLQGIYLPSPNNMATFEFIDMLFNFIWIDHSNEQLIVKSLQNMDRRLIQVDKRLFRDINRTQASHIFYYDDDSQLFISDGLHTFKKVSGITLILYWIGLVLGLLGLFYIFLVGLMRVIKRDKDNLKGIQWPFINIVLFSLPIYLYVNQSFLAFGDITAASILLALFTGGLPITLLFSLWVSIKEMSCGKLIKLDIVAIIMALQLCLVLFFWGLIPTIFWQ
jgi:CubicO group peptidase (beta-lactamase class C family)